MDIFVPQRKADGEHSLTYQNAQGEKTLRFRMGENVFQKFPQAGYSDEVGSQSGKDGHFYDCAVSAAWHAGNQLSLLVQVIDDYLGRLSLNFCFPESDRCGFFFSKCAEDFFNEYSGFGNAFSAQ